MSIDEILGAIYVLSWSISIYTPILTNWSHRSTDAMSFEFVALNCAGYFYLLVSLMLQAFAWLPASEDMAGTQQLELAKKPKITWFDLAYSAHGFLMNIVLLSQLILGRQLWGFKHYSHRMRPRYYRALWLSIAVFVWASGKLHWTNTLNGGWNNSTTLWFCNTMYILKVSMSLIKYIPQVMHNYERKSMQGFAIQGVALDIIGGIASLGQLACQLWKEPEFNLALFIVNFGKIGLAVVTLTFNNIFVWQWVKFRTPKMRLS